jgi:RNA-binding protein NOB1
MVASVAPTNKASEERKPVEEEQKYGYLVLDSGPIIRRTLTGRTLDSVAEKLVTVPGVWDEIKDAKARQYLQDLLLVHAKTIETREPTKQAMIKVADFAKQTGDYRSLSAVDLSVLALAYELGTSYIV